MILLINYIHSYNNQLPLHLLLTKSRKMRTLSKHNNLHNNQVVIKQINLNKHKHKNHLNQVATKLTNLNKHKYIQKHKHKNHHNQVVTKLINLNKHKHKHKNHLNLVATKQISLNKPNHKKINTKPIKSENKKHQPQQILTFMDRKTIKMPKQHNQIFTFMDQKTNKTNLTRHQIMSTKLWITKMKKTILKQSKKDHYLPTSQLHQLN